MGLRDREYGWMYPVARAVMVPLSRTVWRIHREGLENLPEQGPAILCPNHTSAIDSLILPVSLPRRITFVGKAEYLDNWKTRTLLPAVGMIPIDRSGGRASERALEAAAEVLGRGELFGIYPEGTRSRDGRLHKGHTGAARLALRTGAPLVPVGMTGTADIQPAGKRLPRLLKSCTVRIGKPIPVGHYAHGREDDRMLLRQITDELMYEIRELTGQTYVDEYATRRRGGEVGAGAGGDGAGGAGGDGAEGGVSRVDGDTEGPVARSSAEVLRSSS